MDKPYPTNKLLIYSSSEIQLVREFLDIFF